MKMSFTGCKRSCNAGFREIMNRPRFSRSNSALACTHRANRASSRQTQHIFEDFVVSKIQNTRRKSHVMRFGLVDTVSFVRDSIDPAVLGSTANAAFKLFLICGIVRWLSQSGRIPENTSVVLAQVGFNARNHFKV